jgi:hypothetical protein
MIPPWFFVVAPRFGCGAFMMRQWSRREQCSRFMLDVRVRMSAQPVEPMLTIRLGPNRTLEANDKPFNDKSRTPARIGVLPRAAAGRRGWQGGVERRNLVPDGSDRCRPHAARACDGWSAR